MSGALKKYGFINAKLRSRISKILPGEFLLRMIRAPSLAEAVALLGETDFSYVAEIYARSGDLKLGELELLRREVLLLLELRGKVQADIGCFVSALALRYEVGNLKNALRIWFDRAVRGRDIQASAAYLYRGLIVHDLDFDGIISAGSPAEVAERLQATPYGRLLADQTERVESLKSVFSWEVALDRYFYGRLFEESGKLSPRDREIARRMIGVEIDVMNVHWMLRFKTFFRFDVDRAMEYLIPNGLSVDAERIRLYYDRPFEAVDSLVKSRYGSLRPLLSGENRDAVSRMALLERILEEILMWEIRRILTGYPFTIGIIIAYFVLKRSEIRRIMTVLNAKFYALPEERIEAVL